VDRVALQNALLQKQGEASAALLPQWVSGYSFLFPTYDLAQARDSAAGLGYTPQLTIAYDSSDALARTLAERIALNARDTGLRIQATGEQRENPAADSRIVHLALPSSDSRTALATLADAMHSPEASRVEVAAAAEDLWAVENAIVQKYDLVPLLYVPQAYGLSPRVKNWVQPRMGSWPLANVWLEGERP
jgi:peptide/nickel transport system substrate-binding protein